MLLTEAHARRRHARPRLHQRLNTRTEEEEAKEEASDLWPLAANPISKRATTFETT
jgi:hypothetical protein